MQPDLRNASGLGRPVSTRCLRLSVLCPTLEDWRLSVGLVQNWIDAHARRIKRQLQACPTQGISDPIGAITGGRHDVQLLTVLGLVIPDGVDVQPGGLGKVRLAPTKEASGCSHLCAGGDHAICPFTRLFSCH